MATLSTKQLDALRHDLRSLADIKYVHLQEELLDHYATLTEANVATGQSFYEASTAAWLAMGNGKGIQQIQDDYETVTKQQIKARHKEIIRSYLHWPTVVTTLLVGILLVCGLMLLPMMAAKVLVYCLVASPTVAAGISYYRRKDSHQELAWQFISQRTNWATCLLNLFNLFNMQSKDGATIYSPTQIALLLISTGACFLLAVSLAQLTREHFYHKPLFS